MNVVDELKAVLPPIFAGTELDGLTGKAIRWRTIQNRRANRALPDDQRPPDEAFARSGTRVLVRRDIFLNWWGATLTSATNS